MAEQTAFVEQVLARSDLDAQAVDRCRAQVDAIRARASDPTLYLAVVGEFSSGKSAFINALLGDPLMTTSATVSTAVATEISPGRGLELELRLVGDARWLAVGRDDDAIRAILAGAPAAPDLREVLRRVTTDERVTPLVAAARLRHPSPVLGDDVVVIDTPGLNADDQAHADIALDVVTNRADACAVVLPSVASLPRSLLDFLADAMRPQLHRCVFVVTKMAQLDPADRDGAVADIRRRLDRRLGLADPAVLPCSVGVGMDRVWAARFDELKQQLRTRLQRERTIVLADRLLRLLDDLMHELEGHLERDRARLEAERAVLERARVATLDTFAGEARRESGERIAAAVARAEAAVGAAVQRRRGEVRGETSRRLDAATSKPQLKELATTGAGELLQRAMKGLDGDIDAHGDEVASAAREAASAFDRRAAEHYRELLALAPPKNRSRTRKSRLAVSTAAPAATVQELADSLDAEDDGTTVGAAAVGAAIGTIVPGVGTVIGGLIGLAIGGAMRQSVDERRAAYKQALLPRLDERFEQARAQALAHVAGVGKDARRAIDRHIDAYLRDYGELVEAVVAAQAGRQRDLDRLARRIAADLEEIGERRRRMIAHRDVQGLR